MDRSLTSEERRRLVEEAGWAILASLAGGAAPPQRLPLPPELEEARGVFVSLHKGGILRGCIGLVEGKRPLIEATREMARAAASRDPRFPPLRIQEIQEGDVAIEVSCLSPLRELGPADPFVPGRDGLYLRKGAHSGLLLPQVAEEMGWDRRTFFEHTALKAGLDPDGWREARLWVFTVEREGGRLREDGVAFAGE